MRQREHVPCGPGATLIELHRLAIGMGDGCGKGRDLLVSRPLDGSRTLGRLLDLAVVLGYNGPHAAAALGLNFQERISVASIPRRRSLLGARLGSRGTSRRTFPVRRVAMNPHGSSLQFGAIHSRAARASATTKLQRSRARVNPLTCGEHAGSLGFRACQVCAPGEIRHVLHSRVYNTCHLLPPPPSR